MKTFLASILIVALMAPVLMADEGTDDRAAQVQQKIDELKTRLNLTPEQTAKLEPIVKSEVGEMKAIRGQYGQDLSRRDKRKMLKAMQDVQKKYQPQIQAVLTPEQQSEWKKIKEEEKKQLKETYKERNDAQEGKEAKEKKKGY